MLRTYNIECEDVVMEDGSVCNGIKLGHSEPKVFPVYVNGNPSLTMDLNNFDGMSLVFREVENGLWVFESSCDTAVPHVVNGSSLWLTIVGPEDVICDGVYEIIDEHERFKLIAFSGIPGIKLYNEYMKIIKHIVVEENAGVEMADDGH